MGGFILGGKELLGSEGTPYKDHCKALHRDYSGDPFLLGHPASEETTGV